MAPRQSQYDALLEERIENLESALTELTEQHNALIEDRDAINARLDKASEAFKTLAKQQSTHRTTRKTTASNRQHRFPCTVDNCPGHAVEASVAKHENYVSS